MCLHPTYSGATTAPSKSAPAVLAAVDALRSSGYPLLNRLQCHLDDDGKLVLCGRVPTYHLKQLAQHAVWKLDQSVLIRIDVGPDDD